MDQGEEPTGGRMAFDVTKMETARGYGWRGGAPEEMEAVGGVQKDLGRFRGGSAEGASGERDPWVQPSRSCQVVRERHFLGVKGKRGGETEVSGAEVHRRGGPKGGAG